MNVAGDLKLDNQGDGKTLGELIVASMTAPAFRVRSVDIVGAEVPPKPRLRACDGSR